MTKICTGRSAILFLYKKRDDTFLCHDLYIDKTAKECYIIIRKISLEMDQKYVF